MFLLKARGVAAANGGAGGAIEGDEDSYTSGNDPSSHYTRVFSSQMRFESQGGQEGRFPVAPAPVHPDILLAKLSPGQEIELEMHAHRGIGKDHAKFSPVATASYRLLPRISLSEERPFLNDEADTFVARCPLKVFDIEDLGGALARRLGRWRKRARAQAQRDGLCFLLSLRAHCRRTRLRTPTTHPHRERRERRQPGSPLSPSSSRLQLCVSSASVCVPCAGRRPPPPSPPSLPGRVHQRLAAKMSYLVRLTVTN